MSPVCIDDFGIEVHECWHTKSLVWADKAVIVGAIIPGVKSSYIIAPGAGEDAHKESVKCFHESEANCNTCMHLERLKHTKTTSGFLHGKCKSEQKQFDAHPYKNRFDGDVMIFHPHDPMNMPCYKSRWEPAG